MSTPAPLAPAPASAGALRIPPKPARSWWQRQRRRGRNLWRRLGATCQQVIERARARVMLVGARRKLARLPQPWRLCLGSGSAPIPGFINIDLDGEPDLRLDLRVGLPMPDASVDAIYSEHFIEHVPLPAVQHLLRECRRVLRPEGVLRIATPDLEALLHAYHYAWRDQEWLREPAFAFVDTRAHMLNLAFHGWGHQYLFDAEDLSKRLREAGFGVVQRCALGQSDHPALRSLETRADSRLIVEARGRAIELP